MFRCLALICCLSMSWVALAQQPAPRAGSNKEAPAKAPTNSADAKAADSKATDAKSAETKAAPAETPPAPPSVRTLPDYKSKKSYAYGLDIARAIRADEMDFDLTEMIKGLSDGLNNQKSKLSEEEYNKYMAAVQEEVGEKAAAKVERQAEASKKAAEKFLTDNAKQKGVVTLASGVQYRVVKTGDGRSPKSSDNVQVHLRGMLLNGATFVNSVAANEPAVFPVNRVIKGLKEALMQMKLGDKWVIYLHPDLAFGKEGNQAVERGLPGVGPNELVIYEIELLDIVAEMQE
jgi:FKBP-type peptidyl-prolyl cis-trans isomerase FklB